MFPLYAPLPLSSKYILYKNTNILYISEKFKMFKLSIISNHGYDEETLNEMKIVYSLDIPYSLNDYFLYEINILSMKLYKNILDDIYKRAWSFFVLEIENEHELAKFKLLSTDNYELFDSNQIIGELQYKCQRML